MSRAAHKLAVKHATAAAHSERSVMLRFVPCGSSNSTPCAGGAGGEKASSLGERDPPVRCVGARAHCQTVRLSATTNAPNYEFLEAPCTDVADGSVVRQAARRARAGRAAPAHVQSAHNTQPSVSQCPLPRGLPELRVAVKTRRPATMRGTPSCTPPAGKRQPSHPLSPANNVQTHASRPRCRC